MANTFSKTRDSIVIAALRKLGVISQGDLPEPEQVSEAADALETMVKHLQASTELRWNFVQRSQALPTGSTTLTLKDGGGNNYQDIIDVYNLIVRDSNNVDSQVKLVDANFFDAAFRNHLTETRVPTVAVSQFDRDATTDLPSVTLTFYPTPAADYTLLYRAFIKQANAGAGVDSLVFDELWMDVLVYGLASRLADDYTLPLDERVYLQQKYEKLLEEAQRKSRNTKDTFFIYPT